MGASDPAFEAVNPDAATRIPTDPPQVRIVNAWSMLMVALIGAAAELALMGCATYALMSGKLSSLEWMGAMGLPMVGPAIGKATGKMPKGTLSMLVNLATGVAAGRGGHLLALMLVLLTPTMTGCGGGTLEFIRDVATVVSKVTHNVNLMEAQARSMEASGLLPAGWADRVTAVRDAILIVDSAAKSSPAVYAAAVAELRKAYDDLARALAPVGIRAIEPGRPRMAATRDAVQVDSGAELEAELLAVPR